MALTNRGTAVYLDDSLLPAGYSKPSVTKFTDHEYKASDVVVTIAKAGVDESDKATTFAALVAAVSAAVSVLIAADFDTTGLTVTAYANLKVVTHNVDLAGVLYTNGTVNYLCTVDYFVKTAAL